MQNMRRQKQRMLKYNSKLMWSNISYGDITTHIVKTQRVIQMINDFRLLKHVLIPAMILPGYQTIDSASSSKISPLGLAYGVLVSHSQIFTTGPCLPCLWLWRQCCVRVTQWISFFPSYSKIIGLIRTNQKLFSFYL